MIRRTLFLQGSKAQSTVLRWRWRRPQEETAARWRCGFSIKEIGQHNSTFVSAFIFVMNRNPLGAYKCV